MLRINSFFKYIWKVQQQDAIMQLQNNLGFPAYGS